MAERGAVMSFSIRKSEMVNKTFRMPEELVSKLEKVAQQNKVSVNNLVCQCCEYALENLCNDEEAPGKGAKE